MRAHRVVSKLAISMVCCIANLTPAFSQENRGTLQQQMACTPDVFRLCGSQIPDTNRIVACLRQNIAVLSGPCQAVFDSNASASSRAAPGRRDDRGQPQPRRRDDWWTRGDAP